MKSLVYNKNSNIQLISIDDNYQEYSKLKIDNNLFTIAITHKPDNTDKIIEYFSPDIILAGHSHNGQVSLPFVGPLMKRIGSTKYIESYYKINKTELFISGGIGNTKYNMRLFNHPSINFFRLKHLSNAPIPINLTEDGIVKEVIFEAPANKRSSIDVT